MKELKEILSTLSQSTSSTFASLEYESKGSKEVARHTINLNVDLERVYREDLESLQEKMKSLTDPVEIEACGELISSLANSLNNGIGNNDRYTQKDVDYIHFHDKDGNLIRGIKMHPETFDIILSGFTVQKKVITEGKEKKPVKSRPKTIAKQKLSEDLKKNNFRSYTISTNADKIKLHGNEIILN